MQSKLIHGEALSVLRSLPSGTFDAIVTDPPYCSGGQSASERSRPPSQKYVQTSQITPWADFDGDTMDQRAWMSWCREWLREARRVAKDGAVLCVFSDWRQLPAMSDAIQQSGWRWMGIAPWDKTGACRPYIGRFSSQAEFVLWGGNGGLRRDRQICAETTTLPGVFRYRVEPPGKKLHITGKPLSLMHEILGVVEVGGTVLDPFAGSGTTLLAAHNRALRFVGVESTEHYHGVARQRLVEAGAL